jgi:hypothetical protein
MEDSKGIERIPDQGNSLKVEKIELPQPELQRFHQRVQPGRASSGETKRKQLRTGFELVCR